MSNGSSIKLVLNSRFTFPVRLAASAGVGCKTPRRTIQYLCCLPKRAVMNYEELVKNHAGEMIEKLVTDVVSKDTVEVRFEFADDDQWSIISMHIYEEDKEISLRLHSGDRYELYFGYYD